MKKRMIYLLIFSVPFLCHAQFEDGTKVKLITPQKVIGEVLFDYYHYYDTTHPDTAFHQLMGLAFSKDYSEFYSKDYRTSDSLAKQSIAKQMKEQEGSTHFIITITPRKGSSNSYLTDILNKKIAERRDYMSNIYLLYDTYSFVNWDILDSTRSIGGYSCQKAIGQSHGRDYVAWFTTDLPYSFGPRKLCGLPGLILEAYDVTGHIIYRFNQVKLTSNNQEIGFPEKGISTTSLEYEKMLKAFASDPNAYLKANNINGHIKSQSIPKKITPKKLSDNFPIEKD